MGKKKKPEEDPPAGAPEWIVTFSDLVSLLVTLFIMMLTFTTQETDELVRILDVLKGSFGIFENKNKPELQKQLHESNRAKRGVSSPHLEKPEDEKSKVLALQSDFLRAEDFEQGVRIIPEIPNGFVGGSDQPSHELAEEVRRLAKKLRADPGRIMTLIGHCDPQSDRRSLVGKPEVLGLSRARRLARLMGLSRVPLERIRITSRGDREPRARGHTAEEQDRNRRVEIVVTMIDAQKDPRKKAK